MAKMMQTGQIKDAVNTINLNKFASLGKLKILKDADHWIEHELIRSSRQSQESMTAININDAKIANKRKSVASYEKPDVKSN